MRLYSLSGATAIDAPEGHFEPGEDGSWDTLPDAVFERLHGAAVRGRKLWEDEIERSARLHGEEAARRRDPESLYSTMGDLTQAMTQLAQMQARGTAQAPADGRDDEIAVLKQQLAELRAAQAAGPAQPAAAATLPGPEAGSTAAGTDGADPAGPALDGDAGKPAVKPHLTAPAKPKGGVKPSDIKPAS